MRKLKQDLTLILKQYLFARDALQPFSYNKQLGMLKLARWRKKFKFLIAQMNLIRCTSTPDANKMIYLILSILVLAEAAWDSYHEVKLNKSPNYAGSNHLRLVVGGIFWLVLYFKLPFDRWIFFPLMALPYFWFTFDWWINLCRTALGKYRPYWYIGENSKLDKWQRSHGGAFNWFWIKMGLAIVGITIFELGYLRIINIVDLKNVNFFN